MAAPIELALAGLTKDDLRDAAKIVRRRAITGVNSQKWTDLANRLAAAAAGM